MQGPNVDLGHHLLLGKIILETKSIPQINLISYTYPNYGFVNSQWLSEVTFYFWQSLFGFTGLIFLGFILICGTFYFILSADKKSSNFFTLTIAILLYLPMLINRSEIKPEVFSLFILSLFIYILYRFRNKYTNLIFLLIPLEILWVNFHIFFFVGPILILIFLIEEFIESKKDFKSKKFKILFSIFIFTSLSTLFNPQFLKGSLYPFFVLNNYGYRVIENINTISAFKLYPDITFIYFFFCVTVLWTGILIFRNKLRIVEILLSAFFTFLAFFAVRNLSLFILGTLIPFARVIELSFESIARYYKIKNFILEKVVLGTVLIVLVPTIFWSINLHGFGIGKIDNAKLATDFFIANNLKGPIYNNYNIGNYLEYRLYPKERIFVDGNPEEYPKEFFENVYNPSENSYGEFKNAEKIYKFNTVFYEHRNQTQNQNPVLAGLIRDKNWKMIFLNSSVVIFVKNSNANSEIIKKYDINQKNINNKKFDLNNKNEIGDLSNFFRVIGWYIPMYQMDLKYLVYDPNNCTALRHVGVIMKQLNNPLADNYIDKYQKSCQ